MQYEFLDKKNLKKEPFDLKEGVDPATVDWKEEIKQMTEIRDGIREMRIKLVKALERNRLRRNNQT
jgi:hypothetical protein